MQELTLTTQSCPDADLHVIPKLHAYNIYIYYVHYHVYYDLEQKPIFFSG